MAGHAGHSGSQSSGTGGVGAVGGGVFVPVLPDRVDLPFVTETVDASVRTADPIPISGQTIPITVFPDRRWSAEWRAWYALSEYAQTKWPDIVVDTWLDPTLPDPTHPAKRSEIKQLVEAAQDERADALGEIVAQHDSFADYFFALLTVDPAMYPATNLLVNIASIVAAFTVLHFKNGTDKYKPRPRPSQVCPALLPPVPVPGHPSYPSGHATEAHLIEFVLNEVFSIGHDPKMKTSMANDLAALAFRIARNREIAGLHYPSDSKAGKTLASHILTLLQDKDPKMCPIYKKAIEDARDEWGLPRK